MKGQNALSKGQIPQVVLKRVVGPIYQVIFIEKVTVGDKAYEILKEMDRLSSSNGYLSFGT